VIIERSLSLMCAVNSILLAAAAAEASKAQIARTLAAGQRRERFRMTPPCR
jgi:hypothetical protein